MKKLFSLLVVLLAALVLVGCGSKPETKTESKKILRILEISNVPDMKSWTSTDQVSFLILGNVMEGLYVLYENSEPRLGMAASEPVETQKQVGDETHLVYTFTLREQVWTKADGTAYLVNGQPLKVSAEDFVFAWHKLADPRVGAQYRTMFGTLGLAGWDAVAALGKDATDAQIDAALNGLGVKAVNGKLEVELVRPLPFFKALLSFPAFYPVNQNYVENVAKADYGKTVDKMLYNGAFTFSKWVESQWHILVKNPLYWNATNVKLDQVVFPVVVGADNNTAVAKYLAGEIDQVGLSGTNVEKYGSRPDRRVSTTPSTYYLEINEGFGLSKDSPAVTVLKDVKARQALAMAIDKSYITDSILNNGSYPADFFVPVNFYSAQLSSGVSKDFREAVKDVFPNMEFPTYTLPKGAGEAPVGYNHFNVTKAQQLWAEVSSTYNITESNPLEISLMIYDSANAGKVGQHIKSEIEKNLTNVTIKLEPLPFAVKLDRVEKGDFHLNFGGWGPDYPDPLTFLDMYLSDSSFNTYNYNNPEFDRLVKGAIDGSIKDAARFEALITAEKILINDDQALIPLYQANGVGLRKTTIQNLWLQSFGPDYIFQWVDKPAEQVTVK